MKKSRGSVAFAKMSGSIAWWAERLGCSPQSVSAYRTGDRNPPSTLREKIEAMGGPEQGWWDEPWTPPETRRASVSAEPPPAAATADDTATEGGKLLAHIRTLQAELADSEATAMLDLPQRIRCAESLASSVAKLGQLTGIKLTERMILASPLWKDLEERITAALEPWPEAMRAVAAAIEPATKDPKA